MLVVVVREANGRGPDHLVGLVDVGGIATRPTEGAQVPHLPTAIEEGMNVSVANIRVPHHLVGVVDAHGKSLIASEGAQVHHLPTLVEKGTRVIISVARIRGPHYLRE